MKHNTKMAKKNTKKTLYGDTIVEAIVAIAIYSIVAVLALGSMSSGLSTAQRNLESTMSRAMIDSQSDTLRYFYESYISTTSGINDDSYYGEIWKEIRPGVTGPNEPTSLEDTRLNSCSELIGTDKARVENDNPSSGLSIFALSGRGAVSSAKSNITSTNIYGFDKFGNVNGYVQKQIIDKTRITEATLYPRITYRNMSAAGIPLTDSEKSSANTMAVDFLSGAGGVNENGEQLYQSRVAYRAEGVWIYPKKTKMGYDFYVRTCWNPVGSNSPSTFTSVVRLYNAE